LPEKSGRFTRFWLFSERVEPHLLKAAGLRGEPRYMAVSRFSARLRAKSPAHFTRVRTTRIGVGGGVNPRKSGGENACLHGSKRENAALTAMHQRIPLHRVKGARVSKFKKAN
jgi:hypothetical protein